MSANLRLPNIPNGTPQEQMNYMKSYMYQLVEQLQWALDNIDTQKTAVVSTIVQSGSSKPSGSSAIEAEATFNAIKSLIIKSAEIVDAYYEEMNEKLKGEYFALSDSFGEFRQLTEQNISENSENITQAFSNIQTIKTVVSTGLSATEQRIGEVAQKTTDVENSVGEVSASVNDLGGKLEEKGNELSNAIGSIQGEVAQIKDGVAVEKMEGGKVVVEVAATIRSGLLYYEGKIPIYGIEIGQRNTKNEEEVFNKFARFTANRLSFYDQNEQEVAYISDYKLHITHANIKGTLKLGAFEIDTTNGFRLKWAGREE